MSAVELSSTEAAALAAFRRTDPYPRIQDGARADSGNDSDNDTDEAWVGFGLRCLLESARTLRGHAASAFERKFERKQDGSPVTRLEREIEQDLQERLRRFEPRAAFVGEETGGVLPSAGLALVVDPVDGTWAFLSAAPSWASVLAVFRDGRPFLGLVINPTTGELAHARAGRPTRWLRLSTFGEPDAAFELSPTTTPKGNLLVHLHPSSSVAAQQVVLQAAWKRGELSLVRSTGGSPTWGLFEAARGQCVYVNAWGKRAAEPFDLAAGVLLVRGAGGEVTDSKGVPIDPTRHAGPWIAGVDAEQRARVAKLLADTW